jgi:hypothetical protein
MENKFSTNQSGELDVAERESRSRAFVNVRIVIGWGMVVKWFWFFPGRRMQLPHMIFPYRIAVVCCLAFVSGACFKP